MTEEPEVLLRWQKELGEAKLAHRKYEQTINAVSPSALPQGTIVVLISQLNREVAELESLIESKIYREDDLETRLAAAERELTRARASTSRRSTSPKASMSTSSSASTYSTAQSNGSVERCELCEGPHDLDACPVFSGNTLGDTPVAPSKKACADCGVRSTFSVPAIADEIRAGSTRLPIVPLQKMSSSRSVSMYAQNSILAIYTDSCTSAIVHHAGLA